MLTYGRRLCFGSAVLSDKPYKTILRCMGHSEGKRLENRNGADFLILAYNDSVTSRVRFYCAVSKAI